MPTTESSIGSGVIVGFSLGLVGGGGSILAVPLLLYVVGVADPHQAIGTSALAVAVNAFANLVPHARARHVLWRPALIFAAAGLIGAYAGSSVGKVVDGRRLLILFALLMLVIAAMMLRGRKADVAVTGTAPRVNLWRLSATGLGVGLIAGFYGIGGGFLVVPGLILATGMRTIFSGWIVTSRGRSLRDDDSGELCGLRSGRVDNRAAIHCRRDRRRMDRRTSGETAFGTAPDADARAGVHVGRCVGLHAVSKLDVAAPMTPSASRRRHEAQRLLQHAAEKIRFRFQFALLRR